MKRTWTIIGVSDVAGSFKWYQSLFGQPETPPGHDDFGQILDTDGAVLLCLHQWGAHEHPSLMSPDEASPGNGLLLFFRVDDFDMALKRARALVARFEEEPHVNPNTQTREFSLRDPDGYYVTISALSSLELRGYEAPCMRPDGSRFSMARGRFYFICVWLAYCTVAFLLYRQNAISHLNGALHGWLFGALPLVAWFGYWYALGASPYLRPAQFTVTSDLRCSRSQRCFSRRGSGCCSPLTSMDPSEQGLTRETQDQRPRELQVAFMRQ